MVEMGVLAAEANERVILQNRNNYVQDEDAMREDLIGMQMYDPAIYAVGDALDPLFLKLKHPGVVHPDTMTAEEWLPGAKRVLSFFLPFTDRVKEKNGEDLMVFSDEWMHARMEGEVVLGAYRNYIRDRLIDMGYDAVAPVSDPRFGMAAPFASKWSERHVGYISGLGTFSMSKGLITAKGVAGRLCSVVTTCGDIPVTVRPYRGLTEYCNECGLCAQNCPADAIDRERGVLRAKDHGICAPFINAAQKLPPRGKSQKSRYGCGKCQVKTPCQDGIARV